jgi:uncharacterized damage-inducible protein DinB
MDALALIRRLHEHRGWVNRILLEAAEKLPAEQLRAPLPIGQGSVWRSLMHLYAGEYVWLGALQGDPHATLPGDLAGQLPGNQAGDGTLQSLPDLRERWNELDRRWEAYRSDLTAASLDEPVYKVPSGATERGPLATSRGDVLLHLSLHAQYTTAQTVNMLRQLGVKEFPDVMLISLAREQHPGNSGA